MSEQKMVLSEPSGRLEVECRALCGQLEAARKALEEEERDCVRIKAKIVDDQTESIKKLKSAVLDRDEQLRTCRDDALAEQRSLEAQLGGEMDARDYLFKLFLYFLSTHSRFQIVLAIRIHTIQHT